MSVVDDGAGSGRALAPLRRRSYRLLVVSLASSLFATGAWSIAVVWQNLAIGGDVVSVAAVGATSATTAVLTFLLGGVLADRLPARRLLILTETLRAVGVGIVALTSLTGHVGLGLLVVVAAVQGVATGLFMPAYSALLVRVLDPAELPAANGVEGILRPVLGQALGPAAAGLLVSMWSPAIAVAAAALGAVLAAVAAARLPHVPPDRAATSGSSVLAGLAEGFHHVRSTRWLLAVLLYSSVATLIVMGPLQVLTPFAVQEVGGGPAEHALVMAAFGVGAAVGSGLFLFVRLPRRHLTTMMVCWALACLPLAVFGAGFPVLVMVGAALVVGALFNAPMVIWGTALQYRVPRALIGRVSSLDFFVSLGLLPVSVALAGPLGAGLGLQATFLVAATVPALLAVVTLVVGRLRHEETARPLALEGSTS